MGKEKRFTVVAGVLAAVIVGSGLAQVWFASYAASSDQIIYRPEHFVIPGWVLEGDRLKIGVNYGGTFITGGWNVIRFDWPTQRYPTAGFQFPKYARYESLAVPNITATGGFPAYGQWVEGYSISYRIYDATAGKWVDRISYWWPALGWDYRSQTEDRWGPPAESRLKYWKSSLVRNDADRAIVQSYMNTTDGAFTLKFTFYFPKHQAYVELRTDIYSYKTVKDVLYKRIVDWDAMGLTNQNEWSSGPNVAYAREIAYIDPKNINQILSVTGYAYMKQEQSYSVPVYVDLWAWDDLKKEGPGDIYGNIQNGGIVQSPAGWIQDDYCAAIYYELGQDMGKGSIRTVYTVYQAALDGSPDAPM